MQNVLRIIAIVIEVIFLLWFLLPIRFHIFKAGNLLGVAICLIALFRTAFSSVYHQLDAFMLQNPITKIIWLIIKCGCILFAVYAVIVSICMIVAMKIKPKKNATAVILGAQVKPWGASRLLLQRIKAAENYLDQNPVAKAIASGGQGDNEPMSEAACILENMLRDGVDPDRIIVEDQSVNTEQNLLYSVKILRERQLGDRRQYRDRIRQLPSIKGADHRVQDRPQASGRRGQYRQHALRLVHLSVVLCAGMDRHPCRDRQKARQTRPPSKVLAPYENIAARYIPI